MPEDRSDRPRRLVCLRGAMRYWFGVGLIAIGLLTSVFIAVMAAIVDGPSATSPSTMLSMAAWTVVGFSVAGLTFMRTAPRIVVDLETRTVRDAFGATTPLDDFVAVARVQTVRKVTTGSGASLSARTNHVALVRRSDRVASLALESARDADDARAAAEALLAEKLGDDDLFVLEECSDGRAERLGAALCAAGLPLVSRRIGEELEVTPPP